MAIVIETKGHNLAGAGLWDWRNDGMGTCTQCKCRRNVGDLTNQQDAEILWSRVCWECIRKICMDKMPERTPALQV